MVTITATARTAKKSLGKLRNEGKIPAIIYGGVPAPIAITIDSNVFKKAWQDAGGSSTVEVQTDSGAFDCIIHDFDLDPVSEKVLHVDLLALDKNKKVEVDVELVFVGTSPAVKSGLGVLEKMLHEIKIEALPRDLIKSIEVDLSILQEVGSQILVKDLRVPQTITIKEGADEVIAVITAIKEEKEEASLPIDMSAIELSESKGKKPEDAAAAEEKSE